jgi:hypothetical protein
VYSLALWVLAIVEYAEICLRLEPFRKQLAEAERLLADFKHQLAGDGPRAACD